MSEKQTVLVVEDDAEARDALAATLEDAGFEVLQADEGLKALQIINARPKLDALYTDINLSPPVPDGWDVADAFRVFYHDAPVIYASGFSPQHIRRVPDSMFFPKPCRPTEITRALKILLGVVFPEGAQAGW